MPGALKDSSRRPSQRKFSLPGNSFGGFGQSKLNYLGFSGKRRY